jgi:predicted nucleotidyltransferase component of viral defense system
MYIENINKFLNNYENINKKDFLLLLKKSNKKWFVLTKLEKDFLLTLILIKFWEKYSELIFKGGTCLNKIYFPYFRLSEDLDFVINHTK